MKGDPGRFGKSSELISANVFLRALELTQPSGFRFLDTSKQAIGMLFIHFANVYLSDLTEEDPCSLWVFFLAMHLQRILRYMLFTPLTLQEGASRFPLGLLLQIPH